MRNESKLRISRNKIPFLKLIPDDLYFGLDATEFFIPAEEINALRGELEQELKHHVMTYNGTGLNLKAPADQQLCAHLKPARLLPSELQLLRDYGAKVKSTGVSFGIYQKPLEIIPVSKSQIFKFYKSKGLTQQHF